MQRKAILAIVVLVIIALVITVVVRRQPAVQPDEIRIGIVLPATGKFAKSGALQRRGYEMALLKINASGGLNGHKLELVYKDDEGKPESATSAGEALAADTQVLAIVGSYSSGCTIPLASIAAKHRIPLLVCNASEEVITKQNNQWVFRSNATSATYASTILDMARTVGNISMVSILYVKSSWGAGIFKRAMAYCEGHGIKVVYSAGYESKELDFSSFLTKAKAASPDALLMFSYEVDAVALMRTARQLRFKPKMFLGGGAGFAVPSFITDIGDTAEYVFSVAQWSPDVNWPGARKFNEEYRHKYGVDAEYHPAAAYAALTVIADALRRAPSVDRDGLQAALKQTDLMTLYGPIKFVDYKGFTNQNRHPMLVIQVQKQKFVTVYPQKWATAEAVYPMPVWSEQNN